MYIYVYKIEYINYFLDSILNILSIRSDFIGYSADIYDIVNISAFVVNIGKRERRSSLFVKIMLLFHIYIIYLYDNYYYMVFSNYMIHIFQINFIPKLVNSYYHFMIKIAKNNSKLAIKSRNYFTNFAMK